MHCALRCHNFFLQRYAPGPAEQHALESEWTFTKASEGQKLGTIALGAVNLVGVLYLSSLMAQPYVAQSLAQSSLGFMTGLLPFLQVRPHDASSRGLHFERSAPPAPLAGSLVLV